MQMRAVAEPLDHFDFARQRALAVEADGFGANAQPKGLIRRANRRARCQVDNSAPPASVNCARPSFSATATGRKFIAGEPTKRATNSRRGPPVDFHRRADLLDLARVHHDDAPGQRHRLDLIMGDENRRGARLLMQAREFDAGAHAQGGVEIRQRLVEQESLGVFDERAPDRHALALAAGKLAGLARRAEARSRGFWRPAGHAGRSARARRRCSSARTPYSRRSSYAGRAHSAGTPSRPRARRAADGRRARRRCGFRRN